MKKFNKLYQQILKQCKDEIGYIKYQKRIKQSNILLEFAPNLFTPKSFMDKVKEEINNSWNEPLYYTLNDIIKISNNQLKNKEKFNNYLKKIQDTNKDFVLIVLFVKCQQNFLRLILSKIDTIINKKKQEDIINYFLQNKNCKGCTFSNFPIIKNDPIIIVLNENLINSQQIFQIVLNHQLEHYFDEHCNENQQNLQQKFNNSSNLSDDVIKFINNTQYNKLFELCKKIGYLKTKFQLFDLIQHMFLNNEFYPMCSDLSNSFMYYFQQKQFKNFSIKDRVNFILSKCNQQFLLSENFKNLPSYICDSLLFLYICKNISQQKFNICLETLTAQFKENVKNQNIFIYLKNKISDLFKKINL